jgi:hypothetical protein
MPKDTELYDLLGVKPEATDIEYVLMFPFEAVLMVAKTEKGLSKESNPGKSYPSMQRSACVLMIVPSGQESSPRGREHVQGDRVGRCLLVLVRAC